jgi:hypothetical protein
MRTSLLSSLAFASITALTAVVQPADASAAKPAKAAAAVASKIPEVVIAHARLTVGDVLPTAAPDAAPMDLGLSPALGGSRMLDRDEIALAFTSRQMDAPADIPQVVRVTRKADHIGSVELDQIVRQALDARMPKGASLTGIHLTRPLEVPSGWTRVSAELPRPPRKTGPLSSATTLSFFEGDQPIAMASIPVDLVLSDLALVPDVSRGSRITLVIRRGLVEISTLGSANIDGDIGDAVPILLKPSGHIVQARIEDRDHAIALDTN